MYICVRDIEFTYFYDFSIECWNCSDSVIYFFHFIIDCEKHNDEDVRHTYPNS